MKIHISNASVRFSLDSLRYPVILLELTLSEYGSVVNVTWLLSLPTLWSWLTKLAKVLGVMENSQYATHLPLYSTCDCQPYQACWYWSAVQPVETGTRGCPDLMDHYMKPRGTGTSALTWLFISRVVRDHVMSSPLASLLQPRRTHVAVHWLWKCIDDKNIEEAKF